MSTNINDDLSIEDVNSTLKKIVNDNTKIFFTWKPVFTCQTASEAPTVVYSYQQGYGCKIKITDEISIVFITFNLMGVIKAISSGNNYAAVGGLPYGANPLTGLYSAIHFVEFYKGVSGAPLPTGYCKSKMICIQNGTRGTSADKWMVWDTENAVIRGSGFYFTTT